MNGLYLSGRDVSTDGVIGALVGGVAGSAIPGCALERDIRIQTEPVNGWGKKAMTTVITVRVHPDKCHGHAWGRRSRRELFELD